MRAVRLESDELRSILTPGPTYEREERDRFYAVLADLAALLSAQGFAVLIDATGTRRAYRGRAREKIGNFLEVLVRTPREIREARDPKGLYRLAREGRAPHLPGSGEPYEEPDHPELTVAGDADAAESARQIRGAPRAGMARLSAGSLRGGRRLLDLPGHGDETHRQDVLLA